MEQRESSHAVEFVLDSNRVSGEIVAAGGPRRLVDILNAFDGSTVPVREATVDDPTSAHAAPKSFGLVQVHLSTILFAIPHGADILHKDPFEVILKVPVECTFVVPGYEITGNIYLLAEADPREAQLLGARHFMAMTNVRVVSLNNSSATWSAEVAVVNLERALLFAPHVKTSAAVA